MALRVSFSGNLLTPDMTYWKKTTLKGVFLERTGSMLLENKRVLIVNSKETENQFYGALRTFFMDVNNFGYDFSDFHVMVKAKLFYMKLSMLELNMEFEKRLN